MKIRYIGHAGILIKEGDTLIAYDPFLSGEFWWNGKFNTYHGESPWIGTEERQNKFIETYAERLTAVIISHAHMDHFDPSTIVNLINNNREIQIFAPKPVIDMLMATSILNTRLVQFFTKVTWDGTYELGEENSKVIVHTMPNDKIQEEKYPYRVGFLVENPQKDQGLLLPGDSWANSYWDFKKGKVTDVVTWGKAVRKDLVPYFQEDESGSQLALNSVWIIHWEAFTPGNFDCNQDPQEFINIVEDHGVKAGTLKYDGWISL